jgi:hypothetical protein
MHKGTIVFCLAALAGVIAVGNAHAAGNQGTSAGSTVSVIHRAGTPGTFRAGERPAPASPSRGVWAPAGRQIIRTSGGQTIVTNGRPAIR